MTTETVLVMTQLIRFGMEGIESMQKGEKTDEEVMADYDAMVLKVRQASDRWRNAGA